jgi:hypothetical protein
MTLILKKPYLTLFFIQLISCGPTKEKPFSKSLVDPLLSVTGSYQGIFHPINSNQTPRLRGSLTIVYKDNLTATIRLAGASSNSLTIQGIHSGRCPGPEDDLNQDGHIDAEEGFHAYQGMLIPLDDDLSSQHMGWGIFPVTDAFGEYIWSRVGPIRPLLEDLKDEDINLQDELIKLREKDLNLEGKVVVVRGLSANIPLPETVAGKGRLTPHASFPIACGNLKRIKNSPGIVVKDGELSFSYDPNYQGHGTDDEASFPDHEDPDVNYGN